MKIRAGHHYPELTAAHASMLPSHVADGAAGGKWIMLLPLGRFAGRDGRGPYDTGTAANMQEVVANTIRRAGTAELVVDYDHQSIFAAVPKVGGVAPAAGWMKEFDVRTDGLWARIEWTEAAAQKIRAGEYRYISPVYNHDKSGKVTVLLHAGLTNTPNLDLAAVAASASQPPQEPEMKTIALALGLAETAGEEQILTAINSALTSSSAIAVAAGLAATAKGDEVLTAVQSAVTAAAASVDPAQFVPVAQVAALQTEINSLKGRMDGDAAETAVNKAITEGKLVPALRSWAIAYHKSDAAGFEGFIAGSPVLTAAQRATTAAPATGSSADPVLSDEDTAVMSQMGLTKEQFLQARKAGE